MKQKKNFVSHGDGMGAVGGKGMERRDGRRGEVKGITWTGWGGIGEKGITWKGWEGSERRGKGLDWKGWEGGREGGWGGIERGWEKDDILQHDILHSKSPSVTVTVTARGGIIGIRGPHTSARAWHSRLLSGESLSNAKVIKVQL